MLLVHLTVAVVPTTQVSPPFGSVSVMGFVEAVERSQPTTRHHIDEDYQFRLTAPTYAISPSKITRLKISATIAFTPESL